MNNYELWLKNVSEGPLKEELFSLSGEQLSDAFFKDLEFGTAGMRGKMGVGTNRMNVYTVGRVSFGVAEYMNSRGLKSVCISYDSRLLSEEFARTAAAVFASLGLKARITRELMPTPFLSFAVRALRADMGVMITASHNPKEYNGYKVYGADGCQLTEAASAEVSRHIAATDIFAVNTDGFERYLAEGKIEFIGDEVERDYLAAVRAQSLNRADIKVAYTPLNGTGYRLVRDNLIYCGAEVCVAEEQGMPDGNFTTCPYPNPEKKETLKIGLKVAEENGCDLLIATDPDADRMSAAVLHNGEYVVLSGNETGVLLAEYLLSERKRLGKLPKRPVIARSIVSTSLADRVAAEYGATVKPLLTGFKYIGEYIGELERRGAGEDFVLGFEESCGYLTGGYVRDKDAVAASMLFAEMCAVYKKRGITAIDALNAVYDRYGYYRHEVFSYKFEGESGAEKMKFIMSRLRSEPPKVIGARVVSATDFSSGIDGLPPADVLLFETESGRVIIRPSGTEPLIKVYVTAVGSREECVSAAEKAKASADELFL